MRGILLSPFSLLRLVGMTAMLFVQILLTCSSYVSAEPTGNPVRITEIRPYQSTQRHVILRVSSSELCSNEYFTIPAGEPGGKEMYAAALTAFIAGKQVMLEVSDQNGCQGFGTKLQSIYILE
jgi:hypothetical protein